MSTRFIISGSLLGIDDQIEEIQDVIDSLLTDDIDVHAYLQQIISILGSAITRLTIENINADKNYTILKNRVDHYEPISTIPIPANLDIYHPNFKTDIASRYFDYSIESTISAINREIILANTANESFSVILPTNSKIGTTVSIVDYSITFDINNLIVTTGGFQKIVNRFEDYVLNFPNLYNFIYTGEQFGWVMSNDNSESQLVYVNSYYKVQNHDKILVDSSASSFTLFLNESPVEYDHFTVIDVCDKLGTNSVIIDANNQLILGERSVTLDIVELSISFIYHIDKWLYVEDLPTDSSRIIDIIGTYECSNNDYIFLGSNIEITLHNTPNIGDIVVLVDNCDTSINEVTIKPNGSMINGYTENLIIDIKYNSFTLIYVNPTKGWLIKG